MTNVVAIPADGQAGKKSKGLKKSLKKKLKEAKKNPAAHAKAAKSKAQSPIDRYFPSPIFDDFSVNSEGRKTRLDRKLYEKELARLQV